MNTDTEDLTTLDHRTFDARAERHRRELDVHCYRLMGSFDDAEDLVEESVLGCSARDTAAVLETTVASVNSALQRARGGLRDVLPENRRDWRAETTAAERDLLARYVDCTERVDLDGLAALLHEDARFSMPP